MSARDDFELVRQACETLEAVLPSEKRADDSVAAFNRLFTPKPLRELVAEGWTRFQVEEVPESGKYWLFEFDNEGKLYSTGLDLQDYRDWEWRKAIPILTPEDMGVG